VGGDARNRAEQVGERYTTCLIGIGEGKFGILSNISCVGVDDKLL
jgi:hypothetical protein